MTSFNEKTPLMKGATAASFLTIAGGASESVTEGEIILSNSGRHGSIKYCAHGRMAQNCCQLEEIDDKSTASMNLKQSTSNWSHCHSPDSSKTSDIDSTARRKLIIACVLCLLFMAAEAVGGWLANSLAIATDAAHLLTDLASFLISLFSLWLSSRPASKKYNFGWYRAEVVGALTSVLLIWVITGILVYLAIQRLITKEYDVHAEPMLITAGLGVLVNIIMGLQLHGLPGGHGHSHGGGGGDGHSHAHHDDHEESGHGHGHSHGKSSENINVRAALIHVIGDFLQSLGVFVAALIIYFYPQYGFIDPICTFLFSILVLFTTYNILKDVLNVFMEGMPNNINFLDVQKMLLETQGVVTVHNLRIWSLSLDKVAMSAHLAILREADAKSVLKSASNSVRAKYDIYELTIQVEEYQNDMDACVRCKNP